MKTIFLLFLITISLFASSERKIIIGSFPSQLAADKALKKFQSKLDSEFLATQDQYHFNIVARVSGNSYIIALEPFESYQEAKKIKNLLPDTYADAFINKYIPPKTEPEEVVIIEAEEAIAQEVIIQDYETPLAIEEHITPKQTDSTAPPVEKIIQEKVIQESIPPQSVETVNASLPAVAKPLEEPLKEESIELIPSQDSNSSMLLSILIAGASLLFLLLIKFFRDNLLLKEKFKSSESLYYNCFDEKNNLEETLKSKDAFLENLTHSLKKPIDSILHSTHSLSSITTNRKEHELLDSIATSSSKLDEIINNIIDITNLRSNSLNLERIEFNINNILETVATSVNQTAQEKNIEITFDVDTKIPIKFMGDPLRINQILTNILNQSLNNTQRGEVIISLKALECSDTSVNLEFTFRDTGTGFKQEDIDSVFKDFVDEHVYNIDSNIKIGLIMSKQLINTMGGDINLKSSYGHGSSFVFNIVLDLPEKVELRKYRLPYKEIMKYSVLIVDNNVLAARVLRQQLEYFHLKVKPSFSWEHAAKIIHDEFHHIDFLILNSNILGETSIEELSDIAEKQDLQIAFVVHDMRDIHYQIMEKFKHAHFLHKPFTQKKLLDLLVKIHEINLEKEG